MNILSISNYNIAPLKQNDNHSKFSSASRFGLSMPKPLSCDTVSFQGGREALKKAAMEAIEQTNKKAGSFTEAARIRDIKDITESLRQAHKDTKKKLLSIYKGSIAEKERTQGFSLTLLDRIKTNGSMKEKTTSVDLEQIQDASGFAIVLEDVSGFKKFTDKFSDMIKQGYTVIDYEYHRVPPLYKRGQIDKAYDSVNPSTQQRLKAEILKLNPQMEGKMLERDSKAGYSAIHMILRDKKGFEHEVQVYTRAMADVKNIENIIYKLKNGKSIPEKFLLVSPHLRMLKPAKKGETLSPEAIAIQAEMKGYTWDAYLDALTHPFTPNKILKPDLKKYPNLENFDFNNLKYLLELSH